MKYGNTHYYQAPRMFWPVKNIRSYDFKKHQNVYVTNDSDKYKEKSELSVYAKWLYQTLKECEHRYTGKKNHLDSVIYEGVENDHNWFYVGNDKLAYLSGISRSQVAKAKNELKSVGVIKTCKVHFIRDGKRTKTSVTGYYVLGETELEWQEDEEEVELDF